MEKSHPPHDKKQAKKSGVEEKKKSISLWKKIIAVIIFIPFLPIALLVMMLMSGQHSSDTVTVDQRFNLSSLIKSPYRDTQKGVYNYSFAYCGDPHMHETGDGNFPKLADTIKAIRSSFIIFGGDLTYMGKEKEYNNFINHARALTAPAYPSLGENDLYGGGWSYYWKYLGPSTYSFIGGNAKFIVIDTASSAIGEKQMEWIKTELRTNKQPLLFVISHMPIYGGNHGIYEFPKNEERAALIAMFEKYRVNYVLEGHYHGFVEEVVNDVHYVTSGSFSDGILDAGQRHFLIFHVYGPNVKIEQVMIDPVSPIEYRQNEV